MTGVRNNGTGCKQNGFGTAYKIIRQKKDEKRQREDRKECQT